MERFELALLPVKKKKVLSYNAEGHGVRWAGGEASWAGAGIRWIGNLPNSEYSRSGRQYKKEWVAGKMPISTPAKHGDGRGAWAVCTGRKAPKPPKEGLFVPKGAADASGWMFCVQKGAADMAGEGFCTPKKAPGMAGGGVADALSSMLGRLRRPF